MKKFLAFTLAEVLITLGIIGVISAMVLPNMLGHWEKKALETQTKHFYSMMTLAIHNYMADNRIDDLTDSPMYCEAFESPNCERAQKELDNFVMKYLKVAVKCTDENGNNNGKCKPIQAKVIDKESPNRGDVTPDYILMHGYAISVYDISNQNHPLNLIVDINGYKGPNRGGRDIWNLDVFYDGTINGPTLNPECMNSKGCAKGRINSEFYSRCLTSYDGSGCFGRFKDRGFKFDY